MIVSSISILLTILFIILVSINIIKGKYYTLIIYIVGLLAVYSTTLPGLSVVGTDISRELVMSKLALLNGWNTSYTDMSNASFVVGWLVPKLSVMLNMLPEQVYKSILPLIFAFTPVILYSIFKKQIGELKAFYAAIFFIIVPIYSLEVPTIGKSMVAETLMALCLWTMFTNWRVWQKCLVMTILAMLTIWAHYTVGIVLIGMLGLITIILLVVKLFKKWKLWAKKAIPVWVIVIVLTVTLPTSYIYYSKVSQGIVAQTVTGLTDYYIGYMIFHRPIPAVTPRLDLKDKNMYQQEVEYSQTPHKSIELPPVAGVINSDRLMQSGLGLDFMNTTNLGRVFRIIQYLTQLLIILGCFQLLFRYRQYTFNAEFVAGIGGCLLILFCCILVPNFSTLINITRWYHLCLFFLAPMFVLGVDMLCLKRNG